MTDMNFTEKKTFFGYLLHENQMVKEDSSAAGAPWKLSDNVKDSRKGWRWCNLWFSNQGNHVKSGHVGQKRIKPSLAARPSFLCYGDRKLGQVSFNLLDQKVRLVSVKAERPNHPSRCHQAGGQPVRGGGVSPVGGSPGGGGPPPQ